MASLKTFFASLGITLVSDLRLDVIVTVVGAVLFGGLAGAFLTSRVARRREGRDLALKLVDQYFERYLEFAEILHLLENQDLLANASNMNRVLAIGNWCETVAALTNRGMTDEALLRTIGIIQRVRSLGARLETASATGPDPLAQAVKAWTHLRTLRSREEGHGQ